MNVSKTLNYLKNGGIYVVLFILLMIIHRLDLKSIGIYTS